MSLVFKIAKFLSKLFFLKFTQKYESTKSVFYSLVFGLCFLILITWFISFIVLPLMYIGVILVRKQYIPRYLKWIKKKSFIIRVFFAILHSIIIIFIVLSVFLLVPLIVIWSGSKLENSQFKFKFNSKKLTKTDVIFSDSKEKEKSNVYQKANLPLKKSKRF